MFIGSLPNQLKHSSFHRIDYILLAFHPPFNLVQLLIQEFELVHLQVRVLGLFNLPLLFSLLPLSLVLSLNYGPLLLLLLLLYLLRALALRLVLSLTLDHFFNLIVNIQRPMLCLEDVPALDYSVLQPNSELINAKRFIVILNAIVMENVVEGDLILHQ